MPAGCATRPAAHQEQLVRRAPAAQLCRVVEELERPAHVARHAVAALHERDDAGAMHAGAAERHGFSSARLPRVAAVAWAGSQCSSKPKARKTIDTSLTVETQFGTRGSTTRSSPCLIHGGKVEGGVVVAVGGHGKVAHRL